MAYVIMASKLVTSRTLSASFPSPESPQCSEDVRGMEQSKGSHSERVPDPSNQSQKRYVAAAALMPFSSGRTMPSKWDDAERWISSPVNVPSSGNSQSAQIQRRAKSKSGPLGPAGVGVFGGYNTFSPVLGVGVMNSAKWRNSLAVECPASGLDQFEGRLAVSGGGLFEGGRKSLPGRTDPGWSDLWSSGSPSPSDKDKSNDGTKESINYPNNTQVYNDDGRVDRTISRRDMATQMYPDSNSSSNRSSIISSPRSTISTNSPHPLRNVLNNNNNNNVQYPELEVKDVQVDKLTSRLIKRFSPQRSQVIETSSNSTNMDGDNKLSKLEREEARIIAWENLQKAKAESSIQKLEMKLEKKRAYSLEKIIKQLRRAEIKAEKMRISISDDSNNQVQSRAILKSTSKIPSFCRKFRLLSSTRKCSTCYPF